MKYIDIHCHLNFDAYAADREAVVARAQHAGVGMIVVGTDLETSAQAIALAEKYKNMWAVIGFHPVDTPSEHFDADSFEKLAQHPKVVGIGECGLDYFHIGQSAKEENKKIQEKIFRAQIAIAEKVKKPLMLHIRSGKNVATDAGDDAYSAALKILREEKSAGTYTQGGDVHFFAGNLATAQQFIDLGFSLSFTGVITFAKEYHEVIKNIPLECIMSETDAPFVSPAPYRGQRNEPSYVIEVAKAISAIREEDEEKVFAQLVHNARILFKI